jgi:hypothetical protein
MQQRRLAQYLMYLKNKIKVEGAADAPSSSLLGSLGEEG